MTFEEMKERVIARLLDGTGRAYDRVDRTCRYRYDGNACAVGVLIPDELYDPEIEDIGMSHLTVSADERWEDASATGINLALARVLNQAGVPATPTALAFLRRAQKIHDEKDCWSWDGAVSKEFIDELRSIG